MVSTAAPLLVRVRSRETLTARIASLSLVNARGGLLPFVDPGGHVDLHLPNGLVRSYSVCGDGGVPGAWRIAVLREPEGRGGSDYLHTRLPVGTRLVARLKRNGLPMMSGAGRIVFIAGGIGITPILPLATAARRKGINFTLLYLGRDRSEMAFVEEAEKLGDTVRIVTSAEGGTELDAFIRDEVDEDTHIFACGPSRLLDELAGKSLGDRLHMERFISQNTPARANGRPFTVITKTGRRIEVAEDETILDSIERSGLRSLSSCRRGDCGTCETRIISGVPDHRDQLLSNDERASGETIMICVSRAHSDEITLEL